MNYVRVFGIAVLLMCAVIALLYVYRWKNPPPQQGQHGDAPAALVSEV